MRVKTEERRRAILQAAIEVFREVGYERAGMAMISGRLGCSKTTLYGYFPSKEALFAAAMIEALREQSEKAFDLLDPAEPDIATVLRRFGATHNRIVTSSDSLALTRASIVEGGKQQLGQVLYGLGPKRVLNKLTAYLSELKARGAIQPIDPHAAAVQLQALLTAGILVALVFGAKPELKQKEAVEAALDAFWKANAVR
jgi:AcrR family transcriptional regulator